MLFQFPYLRPFVFEIGVRGKNLLFPQTLPYRFRELSQYRLVGNHGQVHLQEIFPVIPQFLNKIKRIEYRQKHISLTKQIRQLQLANLIAVKGDGHAVLFPGAGQLMFSSGFIYKAQVDKDIRIALIMKFVNAPLPKKGQAGNCEGDGIGNAGFSTAVTAGDDSGIAEAELCRLLEGLEPRNRHAGDLEFLYFFQDRNSFLLYFHQAACCIVANS